VLSDFTHPHNLVLHTMADFGLLGVLIVAAMGATAIAAWRPRNTTLIAAGLLFIFLLLNALLSNGIYENRMMWAAWLVILGLRGAVDVGKDRTDATPASAPACCI
jgi:uncharacterized membrane protein